MFALVYRNGDWKDACHPREEAGVHQSGICVSERRIQVHTEHPRVSFSTRVLATYRADLSKSQFSKQQIPFS